MLADIQLASSQINPGDPATWPKMAPEVRYLFIPVVAAAIVVAGVVVNIVLSLADRRRIAQLAHWVLLGGAYSLVAAALPMRYLGVNGQVALVAGLAAALACVLLIRWRFGVKENAV
jgi:hypothetical protein